MKKFLTIVAIATAVLFTGCKKTSDFNKYLIEDYEYVQSQYVGQEVVFYEAQITLNGSPVELGKEAQPITVKEVFQVNDTVVFVNRDYTTKEVNVETVQGYWCEDVVVNPVGIVDYNDALKALLSVKTIDVPDAVFVTLRNPLGPVVYENPFYIFGSTHTSFVAVDAKTLEIYDFSDKVVESSLKESIVETTELTEN